MLLVEEPSEYVQRQADVAAVVPALIVRAVIAHYAGRRREGT